MKNQGFKDRVTLLLNVLPEVGNEEHLAMQGGTALKDPT